MSKMQISKHSRRLVENAMFRLRKDVETPIMNIYQFTNSKGNVRLGIAFNVTDTGAYVASDQFQPNEKVIVAATFGYISFEKDHFTSGETQQELLPLDTPVRWQTPLLAEFHRAAKAGAGEQWAAENMHALYQLTGRQI